MVVVGSVNMDLTVRVRDLPRPGETVVGGGGLLRNQGGKGANQAVAAARAGASVALVAATGDDDIGAAAVQDLAAEGVEVGHVRRHPGIATGAALIVVDHRADNLIAVAPGANSHLTGEDVDAALAVLLGRSNGSVVLVSLEIGDEAVASAIRAGRAGGARVILNPAPFRSLTPELLGLVDIITPNRSEAAALLGQTEDGIPPANALEELGFPAAVVTLGEEGAALYQGGEVELIPAPAVEAVDATGAGDAFNGILAAGLVAGLPVAQAARQAVHGASHSTTRQGAR